MAKEIRFSGLGGQGIILIGVILAEAAGIHDGKEVVHAQSYGGEMRGGAVRSEVVIGEEEEEIDHPAVIHPDILLAMTARIGAGEHPAWGTYHFCGGGQTTWHGLAEAAIGLARQRTEIDFKLQRINSLTTEEYPTPAVRPAYSVLDCTKLQKALGVTIAPWDTRLAAAMDDIVEAWKADR